MARFYRLLLDDYSAASFTSFDKDYFGTLEVIDGLFKAIREDEDTVSGYPFRLRSIPLRKYEGHAQCGIPGCAVPSVLRADSVYDRPNAGTKRPDQLPV